MKRAKHVVQAFVTYLGSVLCPSRQFLQQPLRLLQIRRVKPLGEPAIHRRQQLGGLLALVLGLPQAMSRVATLLCHRIDVLVEPEQIRRIVCLLQGQ